MKRANNFLLAVTCLSLAAMACSAVSGGAEPTPVTIPDIPTLPSFDATAIPDVPQPTDVPPSNGGGGGDVLFQDDFVPGRGEWGTGSDADRTVEYVNEQLNIRIAAERYFVWTTPNDQDYNKVHMEVTAYNNNADPNVGFGVICNQQFIEDSMYYFAITPNGEYAIVRAALAQDDVFLTNNGQWNTSDLIAKNAESYRIGVDCANGKLALYVDGQLIDSVDDSTYAAGGFALFVWSSDQANGADVAFDDFIMTQLP